MMKTYPRFYYYKLYWQNMIQRNLEVWLSETRIHSLSAWRNFNVKKKKNGCVKNRLSSDFFLELWSILREIRENKSCKSTTTINKSSLAIWQKQDKNDMSIWRIIFQFRNKTKNECISIVSRRAVHNGNNRKWSLSNLQIREETE